MPKRHPGPSLQYRYEHYDPLMKDIVDNGAITSVKGL
jgi:hypothetical protein